ncbi:MAG: GTPase [Planctomycetota bacterium]
MTTNSTSDIHPSVRTAGRFAWSVLTPSNARGAVGVIALESSELDAALASLDIKSVRTGELKLRDLAGVDRGVVARWSASRVDLFCHGGPAVVRALGEALTGRGGVRTDLSDHSVFPEARTPIEARMLATLARATSPLAVDLLLDQPRRWGECDAEDAATDTADARLARLIDPPLVAAVGPPNIGKSTLLNVLAGRSVAIAADQPGTTRDHVGAFLELDGLAVRYLDLPGIDPSAAGADGEAQRLAVEAVRTADLVLACSDSVHPPVETEGLVAPVARVVSVGLRADLGAAFGVDLAVCAPERSGLTDLARAVRRALVPDEALSDPRPWRFWAT